MNGETANSGSPPKIALRGRERRALEDRLAVRFPALVRKLSPLVTPVILSLPAHWRLRRVFLDWSAWRTVNAFWRNDLELLRVLWHPNLIWDYTRWPGWVAKKVYRGYEGLEELIREWGENWQEGGWPEEVSIEAFGGSMLLVTQRLRGIGRVSGARVELEAFSVATLRGGLIWRYENFPERAPAIEAANGAVAGLVRPL